MPVAARRLCQRTQQILIRWMAYRFGLKPWIIAVAVRPEAWSSHYRLPAKAVFLGAKFINI